MNKLNIALGALLVLLIGCQEPGGEGSPLENYPKIDTKNLLSTDKTPVGAVCYVDAAKYNPLNAKDYVIAGLDGAPDTQFFNYVVLGYSWLKKNENGYTLLEMTPQLKSILANSKTYIKPLHLKGIKVLIEVRSGLFSEDEEGDGVGLGTLDMAGINELVKDFKLIVDLYGIDGFDFNDIGGGYKAYPPYTRHLTQLRSYTPLYRDDLFEDKNGNPLTDAEVEEVLWTEGGSNFSGLLQRTNEELKESYSITYKDVEKPVEVSVTRSIMVRSRNHGEHLLANIRDTYMPDAYSGADVKTIGNLTFIINDAPYDENNKKLHTPLFDEIITETQTPAQIEAGIKPKPRDVGAEADNQYAPFAVDLLDQKTREDARNLANIFFKVNGTGAFNKYGALYFTNLPPISEVAADDVAPATYITYFSQILFGKPVSLVKDAGAGDYKISW
jgi:hypothetical protein